MTAPRSRSRFPRLSLLLLVAGTSYGGVACTGLLGDFEVVAGGEDAGNVEDTGTPTAETGAPDTSTGVDAQPDQIAPPAGFVATWISAGQNHTCAVKPPGHVYCWGNNSAGQLGVPPALTPGKKSGQPVKVPNFGAGVGTARPIVKVFTGGIHTCAIDDNRAAYCWGGNDSGQLGTGDPADPNPHDTPKRVKGVGSALVLDGVEWMSLGPQHTCAALSGGEAVCWGRNVGGEVGIPVSNGATPPTKVPSPVQQVARVSAGPQHSCAHSQNLGTVWCWGNNQVGELGPTADAGSPAGNGPRVMNLPSTPLWVSAGGDKHVCVTASPGSVKHYCFGANDVGQLGVAAGAPQSNAQEVSIPATTPPFDQVHTGGRTTCLRPAPNGAPTVACFGANEKGQLGIGNIDTTPHAAPSPIAGGTQPIKELSVGTDYACVIRRGADDTAPGPVFCWGAGAFGKLGYDKTLEDNKPTPTQVMPE